MKGIHSSLWMLLLFRLSSVFVIQTSYVPDEYWQSLEVAHNMVFNYGYLTWEWKHGLRSYLYPSIFAVLYKILSLLHLDFPSSLVLTPRILQSLLTTLSDYYFVLWCRKLNCDSFWIKITLLTNWFLYYCGSRTIVNTFETNVTVIALYYYPWHLFFTRKKDKQLSDSEWTSIKKESVKYLSLVAVNCIIRPTCVTIWAPLILSKVLLLNYFQLKDFLAKVVLPIAFVAIISSVLMDSFWYGRFVVSPYIFLTMNIFKGIASFYGTHPLHWYMTQGLPVVLGLHVIPFLFGVVSVLRRSREQQDKFQRVYQIMLATVIINLLIFSYIPHKEFRFVLPLSPVMQAIGIKFMTDRAMTFKSKTFFKYGWTIALCLGFIIPTIIFGVMHQKGTLSVMTYLSEAAAKNPKNTSFLFLMPCHSTPLYSHLHVNVTARFLKCDPPLTSHHFDEAEQFFDNPSVWLEKSWNGLSSPTHIICFDSVESLVESSLKTKAFLRKFVFPHTIFPEGRVGRNVVVYER